MLRPRHGGDCTLGIGKTDAMAEPRQRCGRRAGTDGAEAERGERQLRLNEQMLADCLALSKTPARAIVPHGKAHLYQPPLLVGALGGGGCGVADFSRMVTLVAGIGARCFRRAS